jgi:hypothetical protein
MKSGVHLSGRVVIFLLTWTATWTVAFYPHQTLATEARNVRLIGHSDLQGRDSLQVVLKGNFAYIGHHRGSFKPLTGKTERTEHPLWMRPIPQAQGCCSPSRRKGAESRAVQVAHKYFDGKDYLLRNQESGEFTGFEVWDITDKKPIPRWSPPSALQAAHKSWWDTKTGYAYLSGTQPGWRAASDHLRFKKSPPAQICIHLGPAGQRPGDQGRESACIIR